MHRLRLRFDEDRDECPGCGSLEADVTEQGSAGRFWGYRGLQRALAVRQVTPHVAIAAARIARRWYRAKGLTRTIWVDRVERATGRIYRRRTTVRSELFRNGRGFICVNDGAAFASQLAQYLCRLPDADNRTDRERYGGSQGGSP